ERDLFKTGRYPEPFATLYPATPDGRVQWGQGKRIDLNAALGEPASAPKPAPKPQPAPAATPEASGGIVAKIIAFIVAAAAAGFGAWFYGG
ncbi:MAG: hypothetical protein KF849_18525, partial [Rhizobiaceae bacterium]|nr:hypothetical protein [Rhizobiaceae bacterium]